MKLRDLEPGDIFRAAKARGKNPTYFTVIGLPEFNRSHGSATRQCYTLDGSGEIVNKSCRLEVVKTGESILKPGLIASARPKKEIKK